MLKHSQLIFDKNAAKTKMIVVNIPMVNAPICERSVYSSGEIESALCELTTCSDCMEVSYWSVSGFDICEAAQSSDQIKVIPICYQ